jgi:hypothetical protein
MHARDEFAMRVAAKQGHVKIVKYPVGLGADVHAGNGYALRHADANGRSRVIEYLIAAVAVLVVCDDIDDDDDGCGLFPDDD